MSLDALASHAQALEQANKTLNEASMEREKLMRSVVVGVRREVGGFPFGLFGTLALMAGMGCE